MLNKKLMILTIFLVSLLAVSAVNATDNATGDVVNMDEKIDEVVSIYDENQISETNDSNEKTFADLQEDINMAEEYSTITLENDYAFKSGDVIKINKSLLINGKGHTLDGKNSKGFLNVESSNLILKNITFINAFSKDSGAINIKSSNVVIIDCYFRSNHGHKDYNRGGAIYTESSNLICINCCFDSNYLYSYGSGAAINSKYCTLNLSNCYFVNNSAGDEGGAIYSFDCDIFINNCVFVNNSANYYGGAVYKNYYERNVTISNSNFVNNFARRDGGAIYGGEFNVNNCNFTDNSVNGDGGAINSWDDKISNSRFINNSANGNGGAVCSYGDMSNCYFENNHASDYGAIYSFGQRVTLINSTLINNSPDNMDKLYTSVFMKDIFLLNEELTVYIKDNIGIVDDCTGNMTFNYDGDEQTLKLVNGVCKIPLKNLPIGKYTFEIKYNGDEKYRSSENTVVEIEVIECVYSSFKDLQYLIDNLEGDTLNLNSDYIHGLSKDDCTVRIDKPIKINGNGHSIIGGDYSDDYDNDRAMIRINSSSTVFNNLNLINAYPHAIAVYGNFEANNCSFINNTGGVGGGCAICSYGNAVIRNSKFIDNIMDFTIGNGGAIFSSGNVSIYNSVFNNNHAQDDGGAIYSESNINIYDSIFFNCNSKNSGGAIYSKGNVTLHNTSFFDCDAEDYGGIIYSESHVIIKDSEFEHGVAKDGGGAIYARKSINISGTTFNSINYIGFLNFGGAIFCEGDVNIYNSSINGSKRGAVYSKKHVNVFDSSFTNNYDGENGGAIYAQNGTHIFNSNFTSNSVGRDGIGGAIYALADVFIEKSIFNGNSANDIGGAIYSKYGVKVNNSYFSDNYASDSGGAIFASKVSTENTTFFNNSVRVYVTGGAIYAKNSIDVVNSIFKSNIGRPVFCENNMSIISSLFENNSYGVIQCNHVDVLDSIFNNNTSLNDGACIYSSTVNADNSDFINNFCQSVAAAIYSTGTVKVDNCNFINNTCESNGGGSAIHSNGNRIIMNNTSFVNNTPYFRDRLKISISIEGFSDEINVIQDVYDFKINFEDNEGLIRELNKPVDVYYNGTYNFTINMNNGSFNLNNLKVGKYSLFMKGDNNYSSCNRSFFIVDLTYHSFTELQNLIDNVTEFRAIDLEYNYIYGLDVNDTILNINKPITINGYNHIVNGADRMNIFKVNVEDVNLNITHDETLNISEINVEINFNDLILCYGNTVVLSEGSAIHIISGNTNIVNCEFSSNIESPFNAAVYSENDFNIINSSFVDNAMVIHSLKNLNIVNSKFENNHFYTASEWLYYYGHLNCINIYSTGNLSVNNSNFTNNVQVIYSTGNLSIINSYFDNNIAEGGGGSIFSEGNVKVYNSIFTNNQATSFNYWVLLFSSEFRSDGGAINSLGTAYIYNSSFINNSAFKNGGAIYSWGNLTVNNSKFINNEADSFGGSIYTYGNCTIVSSNFENNVADNGSAIYILIPTSDGVYTIITPGNSYPIQYIGSIDKNWLMEQYKSKANSTFIVVYDSRFLDNSGCEIAYLENSYNALYISDYNDVFDYCDAKFSGATGVTANVINHSEAKIDIIDNSRIVISNLNPGNYTLNVKTIPDAVHYPIEVNMSISVRNKTYPSLSLSNITFNYKGEGFCNVRVGGDTEFIAKVIGHSEAKIDIIDNTMIKLSNLAPGNYILNVKTIPTAKYYSTEANASIIVNKAYPTISISKKNDTAVRLAVTYNNEPIESADISYTIGNTTKDTTLKHSNVIVKNLEGNVSIKVKFKGNEYYNPCEKSVILAFKNKLDPTISITKLNETALNIRLTYNNQSIKSAKISYTIGKNTKNVTISETLLVTGLSGEVKVKVVFEGNDDYNYCENSKILSFKGTDSTDVTPEIDTSQLDMPISGSVVLVKLPGDATGTITLTVEGIDYVFDVVDGKSNVKLPDLEEGYYSYTFEYSGDAKYSPFSKSGELVIEKEAIGTVIVVESTFSRYATDYYADERGEFFYGILYDVNGKPLAGKTVQITVNGVIYDVVTDNEGKAGLQVNLAAANKYTYALLFSGDKEYKASLISSSKLTIFKKPISIIANNMAFKTNAKTKTVIVALNTIKNPYDGQMYLKKGKTLTLKVNGKTYSAKTDADGIAKFNIKITKNGKYAATIKFNGDNTYDATSKKITISISNSPAKNKALKGGEGMTPANVDSGGPLNIVGDYSDYLINENVSTSDNSQYKKDAVIYVDQKFTRVATDYNAGERGEFFYATLKDASGKPLAGKTVQIAVNGPIYKVVTDKNGKAGLQVNLAAANTYTYALSFSGDDTYNAAKLASSKLTVTKKTTSITASNKVFKKSAKTKSVSVTLNTIKNPYDGKTYLKSGKLIALKVNGKTYTAKTNAKGIASFKIQLTKKGTFVGSIGFAGDNTYAGCGKSIKITIK